MDRLTFILLLQAVNTALLAGMFWIFWIGGWW